MWRFCYYGAKGGWGLGKGWGGGMGGKYVQWMMMKVFLGFFRLMRIVPFEFF